MENNGLALLPANGDYYHSEATDQLQGAHRSLSLSLGTEWPHWPIKRSKLATWLIFTRVKLQWSPWFRQIYSVHSLINQMQGEKFFRKVNSSELVKPPAFYATRRFNTVLVFEGRRPCGRPNTAHARVWSQASPCEIFGGQSDTRTGFSTSTSVLPCKCHSKLIFILLLSEERTKPEKLQTRQ